MSKSSRARELDPFAASPPTGFKVADFLARHPVFRTDEFFEAHGEAGRKKSASSAILNYHVAQRNLFLIRKGLYARDEMPDKFVLASKLTRDALIAYDGALELHGFGNSPNRVTFATWGRLKRFVHDDVVYRGVRPPRLKHPATFDTETTAERGGHRVSVTVLGRTLVDLLDRIDLAPPPLELWGHFKKAAAGADHELMINWADLLDSNLVYRRLGFFLERVPGVQPGLITLLRGLVTKTVMYFDRNNREDEQVMDRGWNLIVPHELQREVQKRPQ